MNLDGRFDLSPLPARNRRNLAAGEARERDDHAPLERPPTLQEEQIMGSERRLVRRNEWQMFQVFNAHSHKDKIEIPDILSNLKWLGCTCINASNVSKGKFFRCEPTHHVNGGKVIRFLAKDKTAQWIHQVSRSEDGRRETRVRNTQRLGLHLTMFRYVTPSYENDQNILNAFLHSCAGIVIRKGALFVHSSFGSITIRAGNEVMELTELSIFHETNKRLCQAGILYITNRSRKTIRRISASPPHSLPGSFWSE